MSSSIFLGGPSLPPIYNPPTHPHTLESLVVFAAAAGVVVIF